MVYPLGMYSPEIKRDTVERLFDAVSIYGFKEMQLNFSSVCGEEMPEKIEPEFAARIKKAADDRGIVISAVSGTFNMIHPDPAVRAEGVVRFEQIAAICSILDCKVITLCTGTRDRDLMWRWHDDNEKPDAWDDLLDTTEKLIPIADKYDVILGIETEASNVVNTPEKALKLINSFETDRLKIIFDPANLFRKGMAKPENAVKVIEEAFALLKDYIVIVHGKDIHAGDGISFTSAGRGIVPFERMLELLDDIGYNGSIIIHGMRDETEFPYSVAFMNELMR
ncbi:MAG: sugar phosphate isomerase/epimerase [Ruminococcaceae bacterium]|nr:sugar phosphate isomerase/epimerase [Oscillospiraceae bacterium]